MKRLIIVLGLLTALFTVLLSGLVLAQRKANESNLQVLRNAFDLGTCPELCWHGIQFGKTTPEEMSAILVAPPTNATLDSDRSDCVVWKISVDSTAWQGATCQKKAQPIMEFGLYNLTRGRKFRVIDAIALFGNPLSVDCRVFQFWQSGRAYSVRLFFDHGISIVADRVLPIDRFIVDPAMVVTRIEYRPLHRPDTNCICAWRGFNYTRADIDTRNAIGTCPVMNS